MAIGTSVSRSIVITGASSGIGEGLAKHYAEPGTFLALSGRCKERLMKVAAECEEAGATVEAVKIDVTDRNEMQHWIKNVHGQHPIDIVFANAGVDGREAREEEAPPNLKAGNAVNPLPTNTSLDMDDVLFNVMSVNVMGTLNTIGPALELMSRRGEGQVCIVSSQTALLKYGMPFVGHTMPRGVAYFASKEAQKAIGVGLREAYKPKGVDVRIIFPGYVDSGITKSNGWQMGNVMSKSESAQHIAEQLKKKSSNGFIIYPRANICFIGCINFCVGCFGGRSCLLRCSSRNEFRIKQEEWIPQSPMEAPCVPGGAMCMERDDDGECVDSPRSRSR